MVSFFLSQVIGFGFGERTKDGPKFVVTYKDSKDTTATKVRFIHTQTLHISSRTHSGTHTRRTHTYTNATEHSSFPHTWVHTHTHRLR